MKQLTKLFLVLALLGAAIPAHANDLVQFGATSVKLQILVKDATTGLRKTGLTEATSGLILSARPDNAATATVYTAAATNIETIATLGTYVAPTTNKIRFKEVDATNSPGVYELQAANALFSTANARTLTFDAVGTGIIAEPLRVVLTAVNPNVTVSSISADAVNASALATDAITEIITALFATNITELTSPPTDGTETFLRIFRAVYQRFYHKVIDDTQAQERQMWRTGGIVKLCEAPLTASGGIFTTGTCGAVD